MEQFFAFVRKEFKHILRDPVTLMMLLIMPIILVFLVGMAFSMEVKNSRVVVVDLEKSDSSRSLCLRIDANRYVSVVEYADDLPMAEELLERGQADMIVYIDRNQGIQILTDGSEPYQAQTRVSYLEQIITGSMEDAYPVSSMILYNPQFKAEYLYIPAALSITMIVICTMMTSISIVRERETGTMELLLSSPVRPWIVVAAKILPYFVFSCFNVALTVFLAHLILGLPLVGSMWTFAGISVLYLLDGLAFGLLLSVVVNSQLVALLLSILYMLPVIFFTGMIYPIENMPRWTSVFSYIIPTTWHLDASRRILIQGVGFVYLVGHYIVLSLMAIIPFAVSVKLFKTRLE